MDFEKVVNGMQEVLSKQEDLRGHRVDVEVIWAKDSSTHISFLVPEEVDTEQNDPEVLIMSTMQMLHDQMGLIQDKMIAPDLDGKEVAEMSVAMNDLARSLSFLFNDWRVRMASKETRRGDECHG